LSITKLRRADHLGDGIGSFSSNKSLSVSTIGDLEASFSDIERHGVHVMPPFLKDSEVKLRTRKVQVQHDTICSFQTHLLHISNKTWSQ
jgi:hypothetical protein